MYLKKLDLQDIHWQRRRYDKLAAYANAKRAQVCLNEMLAEMWHREDLVFSCMHPGWVGTPGVTNSLPTFERWLSGSLRTPEQGADTIIWLATCKSPYVSGRFWFDRHVRSTYAIPRTREGVGEREKLWQMCWQWSDDV
jgi:dehydrogenase/reductase SDR family protein 12